MPSEPEFNADATPADPLTPQQVNEAVREYQIGPNTIDIDTRLSSIGDTESMWPGRPARRSLIRSLERSVANPNGGTETPAYRGDSASSHTRRDLITGDWTIYAPKRDQRPNEFEPTAHVQTPTRAVCNDPCSVDPCAVDPCAVDPCCPFCEGAEEQTPEAVWSAKLGGLSATAMDHATTRFAGPQVLIADGEQPDWDVRVVPNKFPAVSSMESSKVGRIERQNLFPIADVVGGHDVIIESATHAESVMRLDPALVYVKLLAFRARIRYWSQVPGINYISVFKNCGRDAGASLRHSHSQVIATSLMPHRIRTALLRCEHHRARTGCSLGCDLLRAEMEEKSRVIDRTDSLVAFCPFASRFPGLIRITSIAHQPHFDAFSDVALDQLASFLWRVLSWVNQAFPGKAFNYMLHTCPPGSQQPEAFQWSLDVMPRLNKTAGFEWSSDCMINSLLPEAAAAQYRAIARQNDPRHVLSAQ